MATTTNEHGEKVTVIGSVFNGKGRCDVRIIEYVCCNRPCYALHVNRGGGYPDARRFSTQVKRAKFYFSHPSNQAEWLI